MTEILVPVSVGELVDKITILEIKSAKLTNERALRNVRKELRLLEAALDSSGIPSDDLADLRAALKSVNSELWVVEDRIREKERDGEFDARFVELARAVYVTNDRRARIKKQINRVSGSSLTEEKSYADYH